MKSERRDQLELSATAFDQPGRHSVSWHCGSVDCVAIKIPAILVLLLCGFLAGPVPEILLGHKILDPDKLLGGLLQPIVSLSVAVILFEGGLTLKLSDLSQVGGVVQRLVTLGAMVTWIISSFAAHWFLGFPRPLAVVLGAVLIVTGPTVIGPLLGQVRPIGEVGPILQWEGIVIDPLGAVLALVAFDALGVINSRSLSHVAIFVATSIAKTFLVGGLIGLVLVAILLLLLRRYWIADYPGEPGDAGAGDRRLRRGEPHSAGGGPANRDGNGVRAGEIQQWVPFKRILEFKESLSILLVSSLFILLGSQVDIRQIHHLGYGTLAFLGTLFLVATVAAVLVSDDSFGADRPGEIIPHVHGASGYCGGGGGERLRAAAAGCQVAGRGGTGAGDVCRHCLDGDHLRTDRDALARAAGTG